jgi:hypothetical protein
MSTDNYFRSIRGPVILLALGVLMLLDHVDRIGFGQTWPVLIVIFGLLVLAERLTQPPRAPQPPAPYNPGGYQS